MEGGYRVHLANPAAIQKYSEASDFARRYHPEARAYYNRKMQQSNPAVAHSALSHKLARVPYYIMRDQVTFRPEKLFA